MPVTLPKEKTKPTIDLSSKTILLYGPPKIGKSTTASKFPGAIFLECEPGLNELEVFKMPTYSWEAFKEGCKLLEDGKHEFRTIVVDTVDNAFRMCTDFVNAQNAVKYEGDMPHGKGWSLVKTEWHRVVLWGRPAEVAGEYLHKGDMVYIEGRLQTRKWTDKDGIERYTTEIRGDRLQLIGGRRDDDQTAEASGQQHSSGGGGGGDFQSVPGEGFDPMDDEIPFISTVEPMCQPRRLLARVRF